MGLPCLRPEVEVRRRAPQEDENNLFLGYPVMAIHGLNSGGLASTHSKVDSDHTRRSSAVVGVKFRTARRQLGVGSGMPRGLLSFRRHAVP